VWRQLAVTQATINVVSCNTNHHHLLLLLLLLLLRLCKPLHIVKQQLLAIAAGDTQCASLMGRKCAVVKQQ
jgi:hypothetical protein